MKSVEELPIDADRVCQLAALKQGGVDQLSIASTLLTRASQRRYNQPNMAIDTATTYASLPNVAPREARTLT